MLEVMKILNILNHTIQEDNIGVIHNEAIHVHP